MESQNHYYGHSRAFARYLGLDRPHHIRGLVQHGWTAGSPVETHFRDFPTIGAPNGRRDRSLFVWSHASRAWDPAAQTRATVAIGAPWSYLCAAVGGPDGPRPAPAYGTVIMPVHGIPTQPMHGDHAAVAQEWVRTEGPSTVCLYHVEAEDPQVVGAYLDAGHTCVTLGGRTDGAFLGRLHTLLTGASRVVSNRLSTPIVYAAALGVPVAVQGDPMRLAGEPEGTAEQVAAIWPEFYTGQASLAELRMIARAEVGADAVREPEELRELLGWAHTWRAGPMVDHWIAAPASRARTALRRRGAKPDPAESVVESAAPGLSAGTWLRGAMSYLPSPLGRVEDRTTWTPLPVTAERLG